MKRFKEACSILLVFTLFFGGCQSKSSREAMTGNNEGQSVSSTMDNKERDLKTMTVDEMLST